MKRYLTYCRPGLCLLALLASNAEAGIVADLEHHYTFDDPGHLGFDSSGNLRHATPQYSPAWVDDAILGGVLHITGTARLESLSIQPPGGVFTIGFWALRTPDHGSANDGLFSMHDGTSSNRNIGGWVNASDYIWGRVRDLTADRSLPANVRAQMPGDNLWTHLVFVGDGSTYQVIQDGARVGNQVPYTGIQLRDITTLWIGRQGSESWRGYIDDFRVYSRALSDVDISQLIYSIHEKPAGKVDFGSTSNTGDGPVGTVPGFAAFKADEGGANPPRIRGYYASFAADTTAQVTVSGYTQFRDWAAVDGGPHAGLSPILSDSVLRDSPGTMELKLGSLRFGVYEMTTYHHSTEFDGATFDIRLADSVGIDQAIATGLRVSTGTAPDDVTTSTFRFITTGDTVAIRFPTADADSDAHFAVNAFDLNLVHTLYRRETVLAVDFNNRGNSEATNPGVTQAGFSEFLLPGATGGKRSYGDIDVTVSPATGTSLDDRWRSTPTDTGTFTHQELLRDFIIGGSNPAGVGDGLDVLVEGLESDGLYEVTLWSFDTGSTTDRYSNWYANDVLVQEYHFNGSTHPTTDGDYSFSFLAFADATGNLLIEGRRLDTGGLFVFLNALQLTLVVPEPGSWLLVLSAIGWGLLVRRRGKE